MVEKREVEKREVEKTTNLFRSAKFCHDGIAILSSALVRKTADGLDVRLQLAFEQQIYLMVIVVVVSNSVHSLYVMPYSASKKSRVNVRFATHSAKRSNSEVHQLVKRLFLKTLKTHFKKVSFASKLCNLKQQIVFF